MLSARPARPSRSAGPFLVTSLSSAPAASCGCTKRRRAEGNRERLAGRPGPQSPHHRLPRCAHPPAQAPPSHSHQARARLARTGGNGASPGDRENVVLPGSDFTASENSFRPYRKWRTEARGSQHCGGRGDPGARVGLGRAVLAVPGRVGRRLGGGDEERRGGPVGVRAARPRAEPSASPSSVLQAPPPPWAASSGSWHGCGM